MQSIHPPNETKRRSNRNWCLVAPFEAIYVPYNGTRVLGRKENIAVSRFATKRERAHETVLEYCSCFHSILPVESNGKDGNGIFPTIAHTIETTITTLAKRIRSESTHKYSTVHFCTRTIPLILYRTIQSCS